MRVPEPAVAAGSLRNAEREEHVSMSRWHWLCILSVIALLLPAALAHAATLTVGPGGPPTYTHATIQSAIDAAAHGDTVVVHPGTYLECINFLGKTITVRSTKPADAAVVAKTVIDGNAGGSVVTFNRGETAAAVLTGFTVTNGTGTDLGYDTRYGGGVVCLAGSSPTIANNVIVGNSAVTPQNVDSGGGGIYCRDSSPILRSNTIRDNTAFYAGGGVCCNNASPVLTNNAIVANTATNSGERTTSWGGGVQCDYGSSPVLTRNTISGNAAIADFGFGGGVSCLGGSSPTLLANTITGNQATQGGASLAAMGPPVSSGTPSAPTSRAAPTRERAAAG